MLFQRPVVCESGATRHASHVRGLPVIQIKSDFVRDQHEDDSTAAFTFSSSF
jgi:hypothetical protein